MSGFKFQKVNETFRWESDFMALEFSRPSIQGFQEFIHLTEPNEILYYYYTVKIFKKISSWGEEDRHIITEELVTERSAYDFPQVVDLKNILEFQLKDDTTVGGQKLEYTSGDIRYSKVVATEGFACDDFYEVTKSVNPEGLDDRYIVYCGTTFDPQGDLNSSGIRTPYVDREDIEELAACVNAFIDYSLKEHNEQIGMMRNSFEVRNGKLYEYAIDEDVLNRNQIESIFAVGDLLDVKTVVDNREKNYKKVTMVEIGNGIIRLQDGVTIPVDTIAYVNNEPSKEMLRYKEEAIANEFLSVLSDDEKEEFQNEETDFLLTKYKRSIIDRTWMCRDEHQFDIDYQTGDIVNAITPIVEDVVRRIKEKLR